MPRRGNADNLYAIRQTVMLSQEISKKNPDYALFAGADPETAQKLVNVELALRQKLYVNDVQKTLMLLYREHLRLKIIAWFASTCGELSKLGFIRGDTRRISSGRGTRARINRSRDLSLQKADK